MISRSLLTQAILWNTKNGKNTEVVSSKLKSVFVAGILLCQTYMQIPCCWKPCRSLDLPAAAVGDSPAICSAVRDSEDGFWLNERTACSKVSWRNFWGKKCGSTAVVKAVFWLDVCVQQPAGCDSLLEQSVATAGTGLHRSNSYGRCEIKRWKKNAGIGFCVGIGGEKSRAIRQQYRAVCSGICWLTGARWEPGRSCRPGAKPACLPAFLSLPAY